MKKILLMSGIFMILMGAVGFGVMVGTVDNPAIGWAIAIGTELNSNTFVYGGISFPLGITAGGGMKMGNIYATDLGTTTDNKKIGKLSIDYGAVASGGVALGYGTYFGVFAGPALFVNWSSDFIEGKVMSYTGVGLSFSTWYRSSMSLDLSSGFFYYF